MTEPRPQQIPVYPAGAVALSFVDVCQRAGRLRPMAMMVTTVLELVIILAELVIIFVVMIINIAELAINNAELVINDAELSTSNAKHKLSFKVAVEKLWWLAV